MGGAVATGKSLFPNPTGEPMNFFEEQERARRRTGWLVLLFALAVSGTVAAVYVAIRLALYQGFTTAFVEGLGQFWNPALFWRVAFWTVALIAIASFLKVRAL